MLAHRVERCSLQASTSKVYDTASSGCASPLEVPVFRKGNMTPCLCSVDSDSESTRETGKTGTRQTHPQKHIRSESMPKFAPGCYHKRQSHKQENTDEGPSHWHLEMMMQGMNADKYTARWKLQLNDDSARHWHWHLSLGLGVCVGDSDSPESTSRHADPGLTS